MIGKKAIENLSNDCQRDSNEKGIEKAHAF
jgi:hypothetical protein